MWDGQGLTSAWLNVGIVALAIATAGGVLSVFVVLRRWAFVGEGIGHSGVAGAGTVWLLSIAWPGFSQPWILYSGVVIACLLTGLGIGFLIRKGQVSADTAIGIFLVATLAWGFLGQQVYSQMHHGAMPAGWDTLIFGQMRSVSGAYAAAAVAVCVALIATGALLNKEIVAYCVDPVLAEVSGVPSGPIHYLLMILLAMTIIIGTRIAGGVLVTAVLVLPGAAALQISQRLPVVMRWSIAIGCAGCLGGVAINALWPFIPTGPVMVLLLVIEYAVAFGLARWRK